MVIDDALIGKLVEFVERGKQWADPADIAYDIIDIMQWGSDWSDWPKGTAAEYREAVKQAVAWGRLQERSDGKVWLVTEVSKPQVKPEVKQLDLF